MSNFNDFMLDGYALNPADGYSFKTAWFDCKNAMSYSISCVFSGGTPTGTLSLNCSNETDVGAPMGYAQVNSPATGSTALHVPADQPSRGALDAVQIAGSSQTISAQGTTTYDVALPGHRWVQLAYAGSADTGVVVTASISIKW